MDAVIDAVAPLLLIAVAAGYARRVLTLSRRGRPVALWRQAAFAGGVVVLLAADLPPVSTVAEEIVVGHMVQHLLIGDLAGLLIALGLTGPVLAPLLARRPFSWLRVFGNPLVALPVWALNLYLWHLSALYQGVLDSSLLHLAQHAGFFTFGLAMWMPLVGPLPRPAWFGDAAMLVYVVVVRLLEAALANVLIWSGDVLYPDYAPGEAEWGIAPLADQGAAGNVMMIWTGMVTLGLFTWLFFRAAGRSAEKQELLDLADAHGVELDPGRAARAVAAGQGERLRERILGAAHLTEPAAQPRTSVRFLGILVFVVGMASLGAEITAARLMAPFFGASTIVWANTIGIVLVALSVGYWLGGRLADRDPRLRSLCLVVLAAALLVALVPLIARPFFEISVGALDEIEAGAFVGSLFAVLLLIAVPVVLLGTCAPWALRLAMDDVEQAGRVAGRLYAISTVGSLSGTMLAALVLIPFAGTQRTFLIFALALALVAAGGLGWRFIVVPVALAGAIALPVGTVKATEEGRVLYEAESEEQYIRVTEQTDGDRVLELNEGQAIHSILPARGYLTADYWDSFLVLPFAAADRPPRRVAILGNAAGTIARQYGRFWPAASIEGVEIDSELSEVGYRFFDMGSNPRLTVHADDARPWLRRTTEDYDLIVVDAYRQPYIPFYLATREFFELVRERLTPRGTVIVNVGHPEGSDEFERVLGATMADVFPTVLRDPAEQTNTLLLGTDAPASAARLQRAARDRMRGDLRDLALIDAARLAPRLAGGTVYTDDRAPVEWLIDRSILGYAEGR